MAAAEEPVVCGLCGRVLDHHEAPDGTTSYRHSIADRDADHEPLPVPQSQALMVAGRCDFCHVDHPGWVLPAREFEALPGHNSTGDWAACDDCAALIERNQWSALVRRAMAGWEERHGPPPEGLAESLPRLYRLLRRNITGSLKPNPAAQQPGSPSAKFGQGWKTQPRT